jgi:chitinase
LYGFDTLSLALKQATNIMVQGNQTIINTLFTISPDLQIIDRVRNSVSKDLSLPFYSLSALVFE